MVILFLPRRKKSAWRPTCTWGVDTNHSWHLPICIWLTAAILVVEGGVTLQTLSVTYIPYDYTPDARYALFTEASEQIAHDHTTHVTYTIGGSGLMHAVDLSDPYDPQILTHVVVPGVPNDIATCGGYVAVMVRNESVPLPGWVGLYTTYNKDTGNITKIRDIPVGYSPASMITFTKDCRKIISCNEGEAGKDENGRFLDPEGSISIIEFSSTDLHQPPSAVRLADFRKFNSRAKQYVKRGVRWVYHGERSGTRTQLSHDLEPEYLALSPDEKYAYVVLQENNAMAVVDIDNADVLEIYPLGFKDWAAYGGLDASDRDGGINIQPWKVYGMYQPDAVKLFIHDNHTYLVTANEGDAKDYTLAEQGVNWSERTRGKVFPKANLLSESVTQEMEHSLREDNQLGRIRMSLVDGREGKRIKYKDFYVYGGRSFTVWDTDDISLVYDSGSDIERKHAELLPQVFNNHMERTHHTPEQDADYRSDDMGPEVEVVEPATIDGKVYIFVGNQRVSTIMTYSLSPGSLVPQFEGLHRAGGLGRPWAELFEDRDIGDCDMQDMKFVAAEDSPINKPLLLVSGSVGGTLAVYEIVIEN